MVSLKATNTQCLILILLFFSGCSVQPYKTKVRHVLPQPTPEIKPSHTKDSVHPETKTQSQPLSHLAISTLLKQALMQHQNGKLEKSAAIVERALRIQPTHPLAWNRLAFIRLQQSRWKEAEQLALKSNSLANHTDLKLRNSRIIHKAQEQQQLF